MTSNECGEVHGHFRGCPAISLRPAAIAAGNSSTVEGVVQDASGKLSRAHS